MKAPCLFAEFKKDLQWFRLYPASSNGMSIIEDEYTTCCGALCGAEAYHTIFPQCILDHGHPICELESLNAAVAVKLWAPTLVSRRVRLYSDGCGYTTSWQGQEQSYSGMCQEGMAVILPCMTSLSPAHTHTHTPGDSLICMADALSTLLEHSVI